jgi:hypothetical protein
LNDLLEPFLMQIPNLDNRSPSEMIDYFVYFLTVIKGQEFAKAADVDKCFELSRLSRYSNSSAYLLANSTSKKKNKPKFIRTAKGYQLERNNQLELQKSLHEGPAKIETSHLLRGLLTKLGSAQEKMFLQEAIDCYEIGARRAAIVMVWILSVCHLYEYIFKHELAAFNTALASRKDKWIKINAICKIDDFTEIPEGKFIEISRSASIISNDVRKILDVKLGIRNSCGHPSGVTISDVKTTDFIIDLVENVIVKFKV